MNNSTKSKVKVKFSPLANLMVINVNLSFLQITTKGKCG